MLPSVDVVVFSHNHARFIEEALQSVFFQDTQARLRLRILDDASSDSTGEVIRRVLQESPIEHEFLELEQNHYRYGSSFKYLFSIDSSADFIAFLDGDDYWVDPKKLDLQLQMLLNDPASALCHTGFEGIGESGKTSSFRPSERYCQPTVPGIYLSEGNFIGTSTVMTRRAKMPGALPAGFDVLRGGVDDYPLWAIISDASSISFLDRVTTKYRIHDSNNFLSQPEAVRRTQTLLATVYIASVVSNESREDWLNQVRKLLEVPGLRTRLKRFLGDFARQSARRIRSNLSQIR
jgi:glycosyltransferase involved in cell wall biosynthesis